MGVKKTPDLSNAPAVPAAVHFDLPSGAKGTELAFKGRHVKMVRRLADGDEDAGIFALVAILVHINGKPIVMEDLDEMDGRDVLFLLNRFQHLFS